MKTVLVLIFSLFYGCSSRVELKQPKPSLKREISSSINYEIDIKIKIENNHFTLKNRFISSIETPKEIKCNKFKASNTFQCYGKNGDFNIKATTINLDELYRLYKNPQQIKDSIYKSLFVEELTLDELNKRVFSVGDYVEITPKNKNYYIKCPGGDCFVHFNPYKNRLSKEFQFNGINQLKYSSLNPFSFSCSDLVLGHRSFYNSHQSFYFEGLVNSKYLTCDYNDFLMSDRINDYKVLLLHLPNQFVSSILNQDLLESLKSHIENSIKYTRNLASKSKTGYIEFWFESIQNKSCNQSACNYRMFNSFVKGLFAYNGKKYVQHLNFKLNFNLINSQALNKVVRVCHKDLHNFISLSSKELSSLLKTTGVVTNFLSVNDNCGYDMPPSDVRSYNSRAIFQFIDGELDYIIDDVSRAQDKVKLEQRIQLIVNKKNSIHQYISD